MPSIKIKKLFYLVDKQALSSKMQYKCRMNSSTCLASKMSNFFLHLTVLNTQPHSNSKEILPFVIKIKKIYLIIKIYQLLSVRAIYRCANRVDNYKKCITAPSKHRRPRKHIISVSGYFRNGPAQYHQRNSKRCLRLKNNFPNLMMHQTY